MTTLYGTQRRATHFILEINEIGYQERLEKF